MLSVHGIAELAYLTAEFEPFSSSQRPDVLFSPNSGPNSGRWFVVELRLDLLAGRRLPAVAALVEHRRFVQEDLGDVYVYFAVATNLSGFEEEARAQLAVAGVQTLEEIDSGVALAEAVAAWSASAEPPPWARES